jgi:hypothetical protein
MMQKKATAYGSSGNIGGERERKNSHANNNSIPPLSLC